MAKLHFRYGTMGSSKTAQLLMTRFNYMEKGRKVWLIKPSIDTRDGKTIVKSRVGIEAPADVISPNENIEAIIFDKHAARNMPDVIIADECQFFTEDQILQLRNVVTAYNIPVLCYGLRTDFQRKLFPGSKALFELADEIEEVKSICKCGNLATFNARIDKNGEIVTVGKQIELGGNDKYISVCPHCYDKAIESKLPF